MSEVYIDIDKYISKEEDMALDKYNVDETITIGLVPYKEISYKYDSGYGAYCCEQIMEKDEMPETFKISGNFISQLIIGQTYEATGKVQIYNKKKQLKVEEIKKITPKTVRTIKLFLKSLDGMGPFSDLIYEEYGEGSIDVIRNNPLELKKLCPAIYDEQALGWQKQLLEMSDYQEYLTDLINYGMKPIQAKQFFDIHKELSIEKIKENPYRLIKEVKGFGFLKCDTIAKNIGFPLDSDSRISNSIIYVLNSAQYDGNTYMTEEELLTKVSDLLDIKLPVREMKAFYKQNEYSKKALYKVGNISFNIDMEDIKKAVIAYDNAKYQKDKDEAKLIIFSIPKDKIKDQINILKASGNIIIDDNHGKRKIYDKYLYNCEEFIAKKLYDIENTSYEVDDDIDIFGLLNRYLDKKNVKLEEMQYQAVINSASTIGGFSIINGSAGCVDCDTEFFNGEKWKKISDYNENDLVLQYNKSGESSLVKPLRYIKQKKDFLWTIKNKKGIDQCLSNEHNCILFNENKELLEMKFNSLRKKLLNNNYSILTTFINNGKGLNLNKDIIKLLTIVCIKGKIKKNKVTINLKTEEEFDRIKQLLNNLKISFSRKESFEEDNFAIIIKFEKEDVFSEFPKEWYKASELESKIIANEILFWLFKESNIVNINSENNADFIQYILSSINKRIVISNEKKLKCKLSLNDDNYVKLNNTSILKKKTSDGYEYCFTVPSHMLILRKNGKIFITGNCGKTFTLNIALKLIETIYTYKFGYFEPIILAPTGRAAKVASNSTKRFASTIHKALRPQSDGGFFFNSQNNLPYNCVIVDETSMLDVEMARYLFEAISRKTKVIFIGDTKQLASVGPGNVLRDIINSNKFKVTTLNVAKRQGKDSGIYKNATRIIMGEMIKSEKETADAYVFNSKENSIIINKVLSLYDSLCKQLKLEEIQLLVPQKGGLLGTNYMNFILQDKFNHENNELRILNKQISVTLDKGTPAKYELYFKKGDKVINTKNNYDLPWYVLKDGKLVLEEHGLAGVSNGETGRIIKIIQSKDENRNIVNRIVVKFDDKYIVYVNDFENLDHAYAMTIHKSQGSEWPAVIMPITFSSYRLLERNLLYTGYTRAKKWISVIGDIDAIKYAIDTEKSIERQTGLYDRIMDIFD